MERENMSKSKCYLCNRRLKGGEGMLVKFWDGVHKVCKDRRACSLRARQKQVEVPAAEKVMDDLHVAGSDSKDEEVHRYKVLAAVCFVLCVVLSVLMVVRK